MGTGKWGAFSLNNLDFVDWSCALWFQVFGNVNNYFRSLPNFFSSNTAIDSFISASFYSSMISESLVFYPACSLEAPKYSVHRGTIHLIRTQNFTKCNISYLMIHTRKCVYQGVKSVNFAETFAYVLDERSLKKHLKCFLLQTGLIIGWKVFMKLKTHLQGARGGKVPKQNGRTIFSNNFTRYPKKKCPTV